MSRLTVVPDPAAAGDGAAVAAYLRACGESVTLDGPYGDAVVVLGPPRDEDALAAYADAGGVVLLAGPAVAAWRDTAFFARTGLLLGEPLPAHEMRVTGADVGEVLVTGARRAVDKVTDDTDVVLSAAWQLAAHPVATVRDRVATFALPVTETRLLRHVLRRALRVPDGPEVRVGLLGYGAIGAEHATALLATTGLSLAAVCDRNPARCEAAQAVAPDVDVVATPEALIDAVDLVVVSTPPDSHATWALRALAAGKHVVVEKPFAITVDDADAMIAAAGDRVLACYQNRRWDRDYLAVRGAVRAGLLGDVFHVETFVGGYGHPCAYWHSDEAVSGGAIYDWGSHYLDWTLDLIPGEVEWVAATTQKRVWHDVTNADHSRVTLRFASGVEAEFTHSDLAAARKPKWYVLGTEGALRGDWADVAVPTDEPADLTVFSPDGSARRLALPAAPEHPFHRELAERVRTGAPMSVTPEGSRRTVAVMAAATQSARDGGRPVEVNA